MKRFYAMQLTVVAFFLTACASLPAVRTESAESTEAVMEKASSRQPHGYNNGPLNENRIEFYVNGRRVYDMNLFPDLFQKQGITLQGDEIDAIHNIIGYVSEHASSYRGLRFELAVVRDSLDGFGPAAPAAEIARYDATLDRALKGLAASPLETTFEGSGFRENRINVYYNSRLLKRPFEFHKRFLKDGIDLNILERFRIFTFLVYLARNAEQYKGMMVNLNAVYEKYASTGDSIADVARLKALAFMTEKDFTRTVNRYDYDGREVVEYAYTNNAVSNEQAIRIETRLMKELDSLKCGETTAAEIIAAYGLPVKVLLVCDGNNLFINYIYGVVKLHFASRDVLQEKRFWSGDEISGNSYAYQGKITFGTTLDEVIVYLGPPATTLDGRPRGYEKDVLYKNIGGRKGRHYIFYSRHDIRLHFVDDKVTEFMITR